MNPQYLSIHRAESRDAIITTIGVVLERKDFKQNKLSDQIGFAGSHAR
jgi:hypothetical protein